MDFGLLVGKTLTRVIQTEDGDGNDRMYFHCDDGAVYMLYHSQDCCESVRLDDVSGDLTDLIGTPILVAEERSSEWRDGDPRPDDLPDELAAQRGDSSTWTFYTLRTIKGTVDLRWHGSSNGYYSEAVYFTQHEGPASEDASVGTQAEGITE